jgi:hypothetical protein
MYANAGLPIEGIVTVNEIDIICGRGGLSLKHPGNINYRKIVNLNKEIYATCHKTEKLRISKSIVAAARDIKARFLEREDGTVSHSLDEKDEAGNPVAWRDIGDKRAIEKTSQALREGQPKLLKKLADGAVHNHVIGESQMLGIQHPSQSFLPDQQYEGCAPASLAGALAQFGDAQPLQRDFQMFGNQHPTQAFHSGAQPSTTPISLPLVLSQFGDARPPQDGIISFAEIHVPTKKNDCSNKVLHSSIRTAETSDSWGEVDPMPLPFNEPAAQVFSIDDHTQLMKCLSVSGDNDVNSGPRRSSVRFQLDDWKPKSHLSLMSSGISHVSELSNSSALSLDSAMDAAEREAELGNIGEFSFSVSGDMSCGTPHDSADLYSSGQRTANARRSILKRRNHTINLTTNCNADPGLIFTSTLDSKPGGINAGTDISGILDDNRKSDIQYTRSARSSMCSAMTDFSMMFRDTGSRGSMLSIRSADFRELLQEFADSDDDDDESMGITQV